VKGPITPAIPALAALVLSFHERWGGWLARLRPLIGLVVVVAIVGPWFAAITLKSGTSFFADSVGQDMFAKVGSGQESHGAPPGTYLLAFLGTAWPMAPFVLLSLSFAWRFRRDPMVLFCLAWAVPMWIVFELVPTKLPHYVLPLYPALAILVAIAAERQKIVRTGLFSTLTMAWLPTLAAILLVAVGVGLAYFEGFFPIVAVILLILAVFAAILAWRALTAGQAGTAALAAATAAIAVAWGVYSGAAPHLSIVAIIPRLASAASSVQCEVTGYVTAGYREPSLVFLTRTDLTMTDGPGAARYLSDGPCRIAFVEKRFEQNFISTAIEIGVSPGLVSRVSGVNLNGGRRLDIGIYLRQ
jgi:4-amino-4-deoxy-L-arabinose transferase-like glycosyltransferase